MLDPCLDVNGKCMGWRELVGMAMIKRGEGEKGGLSLLKRHGSKSRVVSPHSVRLAVFRAVFG
jgi:hypothetical protein